MTIDKTMTIGEVLSANPETVPVFLSFGMHCLGCPHSRGESVEQAALTHGLDIDALMTALNAAKKE